MHPLLRIAPLFLACGGAFAQVTGNPMEPSSKPAPVKIEPGLEEAVKWKWSAVPSATSAWGMPLPEELAPKAGDDPAKPAPAVAERPTSYEIQKGDTLTRIAGKFFMSVDQLKQFNELKNDRIVIGQSLRIPTPAELLAMAPPPPPPDAKKDGDKGKDGEVKPEHSFDSEPMTYEQLVMETVLIQVFLDREMFSPGAIDGKSGPTFKKVSQIYQATHPDASEPARLKAKAIEVVKQPYTNYVLRAEDFKFITPRKPGEVAAAPGAKKAPAKRGAPSPVKGTPQIPPLTYDEMVAADFLAYASAWEFVAERFHCDEGFLRELNSKLKEMPEVGTIFQVPNVIPFEIESAFAEPLQPVADPEKPVTAAVVNLSRLEISRGDELLAVLPVASARPGLTGRGTWTMLEAIPKPRLATTREPREAPAATPAEGEALPAAQHLPAGPNNPVGIAWINLAKSKTTDPLPYGLHGTGIPARMKSQEGIGGFRMTNWDIARAVKLLPIGTPLQWKTE
ncbi:LysM peptidoglycan-binding domain-containing protein [Luteolibacter flavescens]|uniref:LysM peptidoglycan-binding domain-containing protein n=1 Tax=Luteolibacter flavescens TaxID=1859460 RepID=A0ABT3FKS1_9BACT|nr:LysM peptidoglycan-binding domain-containing protein [Luteolibacter flavescens]MCW1884183.1 LysM peptidoglycan-binding domain-containing protein [Luteolibacter flavescens]